MTGPAVGEGMQQIEPGARRPIWARYEQWNGALAAVAEEQGAGGKPLYLELDDEVLKATVRHLGEDIPEPKDQLIRLVRATLDIGPHAAPLSTHAQKTSAWRPESGEPPPCLALLYVCSAAAMEMRAGDGMNSRNFYGRLAIFLNLPPTDLNELTRGYRNHAELLWGALNRWLEHHEGEKGLPTAYALRYRYAGLPMSQALVRRADRARLNRFFASYGLPPHGQMSATDLDPILDDWISTNPPPVSRFLRDLWQSKGEARERIAAILSLELSEWDGSTDLPVSDARRSGAVRLVAAVRRFPVRKLALDLSVRIGHETDEATLDVVDATGGCPPQDALHPSSRRVADARCWSGDRPHDPRGRLRPAPRSWRHGRAQASVPVPLRRDTLLEAYVETDRLQIGETSMLLAPADRKGDVSAALADCAAPGWEAIDSLPGLPAEWVLFTGVEVYAPLDKAKHKWVELDVLVPLGGTQLTLAGGLRLPAKLRKWSTFRPPEIRAIFSDAEVVEVTFEALGEDPTWNQRWTSAEGVLLVDLGDVGLEDGDYLARLRSANKKDAVAESLIRLRSADTPNRLPPAPRLGYGTEGAAAFSAVEDGPVHGASVRSDAPAGATEQGPLPPERLEPLARRRVRPRLQVAAPTLRLGDMSANSCLNTGAHRIQLPPATGQAKRGWVNGECTGCGLVKRYPATAWQARKRTKRGTVARRAPVEVAQLRPVQAKDYVDWQLGLDALYHLGRGAGSALQRVALQLEPSKLFADAFTRLLEALAHLDVRRNERTWRLEAWQIPPLRCWCRRPRDSGSSPDGARKDSFTSWR